MVPPDEVAVQNGNVGAIQAGQDFGFFQKAAGHAGMVVEIGEHKLQGDGAVQGGVESKIDAAHCPVAELSLHQVLFDLLPDHVGMSLTRSN